MTLHDMLSALRAACGTFPEACLLQLGFGTGLPEIGAGAHGPGAFGMQAKMPFHSFHQPSAQSSLASSPSCLIQRQGLLLHDASGTYLAFVSESLLGCKLMISLLQVIGFLNNMLSRKFEFQADNFAVELGHASELQGALRKLDAKNKSAQNVDHWYSTYHYSHPPLVERLGGIQLQAKKTS